MYTSRVHLSLTCVHNLLGRAVQDDVMDCQHEADSTFTNANHASPECRCRVVDGEVTEGLHELAVAGGSGAQNREGDHNQQAK